MAKRVSFDSDYPHESVSHIDTFIAVAIRHDPGTAPWSVVLFDSDHDPVAIADAREITPEDAALIKASLSYLEIDM